MDPTETSLLVTEPVLDLPILQSSYDQIVFEEYEFNSYCRTTAPALIPWHNTHGSLPYSECILVVDSGFSFTHVTPVVNGKVIWSAVRRYYPLLSLTKIEYRRQIPHKSLEGGDFLPTLQHDGRNS